MNHAHSAHSHTGGHHRHKIGHRHDTGGSSIDFYACHSKIRHWNPEFKVGFSIILLLFCVLANHPAVSCVIILTSAIITVGMGGLRARQYFSVLTIPITFILLGSIAVAIDFSPRPVGDFHLYLFRGYLYLTYESLWNTLFLILKVFGAVSAMFIMTLSTPSHELFSVLRRAHCPSLIVELMHMIYRYIFILMEVQRNMRISAESRLGFCDFKTSCYSFGQIAGNLFIVALKKANAYYDAMEARCYDGTFAFLEEERTVNLKHLIAAGIYLTALTVFWLICRGAAG